MNAIALLCAIGGSTNAVVHLPAIAGRLGIDLPLSLFDDISRRTPLIVNMHPAGKYQIEDLFYARHSRHPQAAPAAAPR